MADSPAPAPQKRSGELILEVACEQFFRQGIRAVGVDEVVTRAGFTKPSLYRAYGSKEGLITAYLKVREAMLWTSLDEAAALHPLDARAQIAAWLSGVAAEAAKAGARGCAFSNAAIEFPEADHPARLATLTVKAELRRRLRELARKAGADDAERIGDSLLLLAEGAMASGQMFGEDGPAKALVQTAEALFGAPAAQAPAKVEVLAPPAPRPAKPAKPKPRSQTDEHQPTLF